MVSRRESLVAAARAAGHLAQHVADRPLDHIRWTRPQRRWLESKHARKLFRAGNQIGKTTAGLAEVIWRATGTHPYLRTKPPPVEIWIVCTTWPQSVAVMLKFWALCPKHLVRDGTSCEPRYGFGKDNPAVVFRCGSVVRFRTTNQGAAALAGATVDYILIDEPTDEDIFRELDRRLTRTGGQMGLVLTPINRPVEYLRQLVRDGIVLDLHAKLSAENLMPIGARGPMRLPDGTPLDEAWVVEQRRLVLQRWAPIILDGEWEMRVEGSVFSAYDPERHRKVIPVSLLKELRINLGVDHGEGDHREYAVVTGVDERGDYRGVHALAEYSSSGMSTPEADADGILAAIDEAYAGWSWSRVSVATGDRPSVGRTGRRSNADLQAALERELRRRKLLGPREQLEPEIKTAKRGRGGGAGSVWRGVEWLHRAMLRDDHFSVHPRCERLDQSLQRWDFSDSEWKDACDGLRYSTWNYAMRGGRGDAGASLHLYG